MKTLLVNLGQLKVWHKDEIKEGDSCVIIPKELIVEMKGKEISKGIQSLVIYFPSEGHVRFELKMVPIYDRIIRKIKKIVGDKK